MKKILLITSSILLLISCSPDYVTDGSTNTNSQITPPAWIIGSWYTVIGSDDDLDIELSTGYKFYTDDLCTLAIVSEICMKEAINLYKGTQVVTAVTQEISENEYKCSIKIGSQIMNYHFQKVSSNTIKDVNMSNSTGTTVLLKKK